ncbi:DUF1800 family protein [Inhella sp.]|uniref:DUF1800 domain-containing protein n=1 Tax=Inhella sp. TaxID=1921806 RepID=UPI0035B00A75
MPLCPHAPTAVLLALLLLLTACGGGQNPGAPTASPDVSPSAAPSLSGDAAPDRQALALGANPPLGAPPKMTPREAARLADQASLGGNARLLSDMRQLGAPAWVAKQFRQPVSRYRSGGSGSVHVNVGPVFYCDRPGSSPTCWRDEFSSEPLLWDFTRNALGGSDQLRQRVALALQQLIVVSELEVQGTYGLRYHHNLLLDHAFGNYRELLRRMILSPVMGDYLDHANNDPDAPNENFSRELLQLFSLGPCELEPTGALKGGRCQPSYDNAMVRNYAFALTGWTYPAGGSTQWGCWPQGTNCTYYEGDMLPRPARHHAAARPLLSGFSKTAGSTPQQALDAVLDSLMAHPNLPPFVSRHLIQSLVSSNPSGAYVQRVGQAFTTGRYTHREGQVFGSGQRGDLAATVAAVLLDDEARSLPPPAQAGQLREPMLFMTGVLRQLDGVSDGAALGWWWGGALRQHLFRPPSVFNFFPPDYPVPGTALVGPAFGIHNANSALERLNFLTYLLDWGGSAPDPSIPGATGTRVRLDAWLAQADNAAKLLDRLAEQALGEPLREPARSQALTALNAWTQASSGNDWRLNRVRTAALLVFASPQYQVPR